MYIQVLSSENELIYIPPIDIYYVIIGYPIEGPILF
jgi:hypothetical protein